MKRFCGNNLRVMIHLLREEQNRCRKEYREMGTDAREVLECISDAISSLEEAELLERKVRTVQDA